MRHERRRVLRRTKIVCTIGPATGTIEMLEQLVRTGMDCARINFSHGSLEEHRKTFERIRSVRASSGRPVAILADLQGPKLRVGPLPAPIELVKGEEIVLAGLGSAQPGDLELGFEVDFSKHVRRGRPVLINDGHVRLRVRDANGQRCRCVVEVAGAVSSYKGVNLPGTYLPIPSITEGDRENLAFAVEQDADYVALSFVRRAEDVEDLRGMIAALGGRQRVIAKIEKAEAVEQLDAIVAAADGLMVARGDLGVEIGAADVPLVQKRIIRLGRAAGKPVITATQMLESMLQSPEPTRAEASDVANAVLDGTAAVMLSGETAVGSYPDRGGRDARLDRARRRAELRLLRPRSLASRAALHLGRRRLGRLRDGRAARRRGDRRADGDGGVRARGVEAPAAPHDRRLHARSARAAAADARLGGRAPASRGDGGRRGSLAPLHGVGAGGGPGRAGRSRRDHLGHQRQQPRRDQHDPRAGALGATGSARRAPRTASRRGTRSRRRARAPRPHRGSSAPAAARGGPPAAPGGA